MGYAASAILGSGGRRVRPAQTRDAGDVFRFSAKFPQGIPMWCAILFGTVSLVRERSEPFSKFPEKEVPRSKHLWFEVTLHRVCIF